MSLRAKMLLANCIVFGGVLLLAGACVWGLRRQREHVGASLREYEALQTVQSAELSVVSANLELHNAAPDLSRAADRVRDARNSMKLYKAILTQYASIMPPEIDATAQDAVLARTNTSLNRLTGLLEALGEAPGSKRAIAPTYSPPPLIDLQTTVGAAVADLADLLSTCNAFLDRTQKASDDDLRVAMTVVAVGAAVIPLVLVLATLWQYRRVMVPLQRLRRWSRRVSAGDLSAPYEASADREFAELGRDINRMAQELGTFYRQLEEMVAAKSKQLARSERLASVGHLAAGVAHEINNPLNIMSGHAELAARRHENDPIGSGGEVLESLRIIRDEAFRCKHITQKLLSLARGGGVQREVLSVSAVVDDVVKMVQGLGRDQLPEIQVSMPADGALHVQANSSELKQVLLNLVLNALEALPASGGVVRIEGRQADDRVEITVADNGRGMSAATLERVFEPFYTEKRGTVEPGTGLGLSISHAIVTDLGGSLTAQSDGPGLGSRLTVRLPGGGEQQTPLDQHQQRNRRAGELLRSE